MSAKGQMVYMGFLFRLPRCGVKRKGEGGGLESCQRSTSKTVFIYFYKIAWGYTSRKYPVIMGWITVLLVYFTVHLPLFPTHLDSLKATHVIWFCKSSVYYNKSLINVLWINKSTRLILKRESFYYAIDIEHILLCLFAIYISSMKCLDYLPIF